MGPTVHLHLEMVTFCPFLVCKFKAHKRCAVRAINNCKWTTLASIGKDIIEDEDGVSSVPPLTSPPPLRWEIRAEGYVGIFPMSAKWKNLVSYEFLFSTRSSMGSFSSYILRGM